jgi:N-acetylmuramic acid 6-phosphate etherase
MLKTEMRNEHTKNIPEMETLEMMRVMQNENKNAAAALDSQLENIGRAVDIISERMKKGGRLFYIGCGTSGRLGVLDASECPPTYGVPKNLVIGIIAGGDYALRNAIEGAEDNPELGRGDIEKYEITELDSVVGISVAGGARYVLGALEYAKSKGAAIVAITSNEGAPIEHIADVGIHPDTGAEVITGSTRMKAGTAHKMILNMISTAVMIRQGHVYENLMINLRPANIKLEDRMIRIVSDILEVDRDTAKKLLDDNGFVIRSAIEAYKA